MRKQNEYNNLPNKMLYVYAFLFIVAVIDDKINNNFQREYINENVCNGCDYIRRHYFVSLLMPRL